MGQLQIGVGGPCDEAVPDPDLMAVRELMEVLPMMGKAASSERLV